MKLIPILFQPDMVRAILDGRKTQTRRIVKCFTGSEAHPTRQTAQWQFENKTCPYGKAYDMLWARETFFNAEKFMDTPLFHGKQQFYYKADNAFIGEHKWKPSIHMPFIAARIFLQVKEVKVERLQDISKADAVREGIEEIRGWHNEDRHNGWKDYLKQKSDTVPTAFFDPIHSYQSLWKRINGLGSWDLNPWVWVIKFERTEKPKL